MQILEIGKSRYGVKYPWQVLCGQFDQDELVGFLRDNFGKSGQGRYLLWGSDKSTEAYAMRRLNQHDDPEVSIYFSNKEDLMAFKLRWC